ncbi:Heparinase II/III family protein [Gammaproteobacteria bacterium]
MRYSDCLGALGPRTDPLIWYFRRLRKMSAEEILDRVRDATIKQVWRVGFLRPQAPARPAFSLVAASFAMPSPETLPLGVSAQARGAILAEAEAILAGTVCILGHESRLLGEVPDWFTDIRSDHRAPSETYSFDIPYRDSNSVGEIKYVWEPSRHHHLTILAAAYYLSGDDRFAQRVAIHLTSWWKENLLLHGVHWISGIEIAIRLLSWVWLRRLLACWSEVAMLFDDNPAFLDQLYWHQAYLAALPSHGSSANNHLMAEIAGRFAAASAFPIFAESAGWRVQAAKLIEREVAAQTWKDGLNRELATAYHGLTFELVLTAAAEDDPQRPLLGEMVWRHLAAMADALASMVDVGLHPPRQGDDDGAVALLVDGLGFDRWHSLLAYSQTAFGRCSWWPKARVGDLRAALLAWRTGRHIVSDRPTAPIRHFKEGGMVLLRDLAASDEELWCRCDHGPLGFLSTAAHGHADALSIEIRYGGVEVLCDPGTYCYHGHDPWRSYFRSTLGHNTLEIDGINQCRAGGLFLWRDHPHSELVGVSGLDSGEVAEWSASHDGYRQLAIPVMHQRSVIFNRWARTLDIHDRLTSLQLHSVRLAFHLGPCVDCQLTDNVALLAWQGAAGPCQARLELPDRLAWSPRRGEQNPLLGWYSPVFGRVEPTTVLIGQGLLEPETDLHSRLVVSGGSNTEAVIGHH